MRAPVRYSATPWFERWRHYEGHSVVDYRVWLVMRAWLRRNADIFREDR